MIFGITAGLILLLLLLLAAIYISYDNTFSVRMKKDWDIAWLPNNSQYAPYRGMVREMVDHALAIPYEEVSITSYDGYKLYGKLYLADPKAPVQIMMHGYRSAAERDFCGGLKEGVDWGYNVILVDQRAHGKSKGKCLTFGVKERRDCLSWIEFANARFGADIPIILYGMSMGAATVLMATDLELPGNVKCVIADCGYSSPRAIIRKVCVDRKFPLFPTYLLVRLGGMLFGGFDIEAASAEESLKKCRLPVLLIHGDADRFVPCEMSRISYRACASQKKLLIVEGAGHGISYMVDQKLYMDTVNAFLEEAGVR